MHTVARGPVPRERSTRAKNARRPRLSSPDGTARDRPSPYDETETALHTVARGPVPRDRTRAPVTVVRDRLIPNGKSRRSCPTEEARTRARWHGEGQALALR